MQSIATVQSEQDRTYLTCKQKIPLPPRERLREAGKDAGWWIQCGAATLGEKGVSAALMRQLELGISDCPSGVPSTDLYSDQQVGYGTRFRHLGTIARARKCGAIWHRLPPFASDVLVARYDSRNWPPGVRAILGPFAGVVVLEQAGRMAAKRIEAERARFARWVHRAGVIRPALCASCSADVRAARELVIRRSSQLLSAELRAPPVWYQILAGDRSPLVRLAQAVEAEERARLDCASIVNPHGRLARLERMMGRCMRAISASAERCQAVITEAELAEVYWVAQMSSLKTSDGKAAERRCEAWLAAARRATDRALACWVDVEEAMPDD